MDQYAYFGRTDGPGPMPAFARWRRLSLALQLDCNNLTVLRLPQPSHSCVTTCCLIAMSARLARKRARTDGVEDMEDVKLDSSNNSSASVDDSSTPSHSKSAIQLEKDEEFWFEDGTVILHAGDVEFRVYGGLLAGHSAVFKELFAQSHPTRTVSIAGRHDFPCPVVKLSDSPYDIRHFLRSCMPRQAGRYV